MLQLSWFLLRTARFCCAAHTQHHISDKEYVYMYFTATQWKDEPKIMEPNKCDDIQWFPLDKLPLNLVYNTADIIKDIKAGIVYSENLAASGRV